MKSEYEIKYIMKEGSAVHVGGYATLAEVYEIAKENAPKCMGTTILYHTAKGEVVEIGLDEAKKKEQITSLVNSKSFKFAKGK
jgi:hypothetical protein